MPRSTAYPLAMPPRSMRTPGCEKRTLRSRAIEQHVAVVDRRERGGDLLFVRPAACAEVVHEADAGVGDVEGAVGDARVFKRGVEQVEQLLADLDRTARRLGIDARNLAVGLVGAHVRVDVAHLGHHRVDGALARGRLLAPQLDHDARAHDAVVDARQPFGRNRRAHRQPQACRQQRDEGARRVRS